MATKKRKQVRERKTRRAALGWRAAWLRQVLVLPSKAEVEREIQRIHAQQQDPDDDSHVFPPPAA